LFDMLIEAAVAQCWAPRSENRWRVGKTFGLMFQQMRQAEDRNKGLWVGGMFSGHGFSNQRILQRFANFSTNSGTPSLCSMIASTVVQRGPDRQRAARPSNVVASAEPDEGP
jgi:hypothetical protein